MNNNVIIGINNEKEVTCLISNDIFCEIKTSKKEDFKIMLEALNNILPEFVSVAPTEEMHETMNNIVEFKSEEEVKTLAKELPKVTLSKVENEEEITISIKEKQSCMYTKIAVNEIENIGKKTNNFLVANLTSRQRKK